MWNRSRSGPSNATKKKQGEHTADVWLVAQSYVLPSTVLTRRVIMQTWRYLAGEWLLEAEDPAFIPLDLKPKTAAQNPTQEVER